LNLRQEIDGTTTVLGQSAPDYIAGRLRELAKHQDDPDKCIMQDAADLLNGIRLTVEREKRAAVEQALALAYAEVCGSREGVETYGPEKFIDPIVSRLFPS
jgi:hypothetical protein